MWEAVLVPGRSRSPRVRAVPAAKPGVLAARVRQSVAELVLQPEDVAVAELAVQFADTIDRAAELAAVAAALPFDPDTAAQVQRLAKRVEAHVAMSEVGPKLLATLDALGATPKARSASGKPAPAAGGPSKLAALRGGAS